MTNSYSDLLLEDNILLAVEFVGRGQDIPQEIKDILGPSLLEEIQNPETNTNGDQKCNRSRT